MQAGCPGISSMANVSFSISMLDIILVMLLIVIVLPGFRLSYQTYASLTIASASLIFGHCLLTRRKAVNCGSPLNAARRALVRAFSFSGPAGSSFSSVMGEMVGILSSSREASALSMTSSLSKADGPSALLISSGSTVALPSKTSFASTPITISLCNARSLPRAMGK